MSDEDYDEELDRMAALIRKRLGCDFKTAVRLARRHREDMKRRSGVGETISLPKDTILHRGN